MPDSLQRARKKVGKNMSRASETVVLIQPIKKSTLSVTISNITSDNLQRAPKKAGKNTTRASETAVLIRPIKKFPRLTMI